MLYQQYHRGIVLLQLLPLHSTSRVFTVCLWNDLHSQPMCSFSFRFTALDRREWQNAHLRLFMPTVSNPWPPFSLVPFCSSTDYILSSCPYQDSSFCGRTTHSSIRRSAFSFLPAQSPVSFLLSPSRPYHMCVKIR